MNDKTKLAVERLELQTKLDDMFGDEQTYKDVATLIEALREQDLIVESAKRLIDQMHTVSKDWGNDFTALKQSLKQNEH